MSPLLVILVLVGMHEDAEPAVLLLDFVEVFAGLDLEDFVRVQVAVGGSGTEEAFNLERKSVLHDVAWGITGAWAGTFLN